MTPYLLLQDMTLSFFKCIFNGSCEKHFHRQNILLLLNTTHSEVSLLFGNETLMNKLKQFISPGNITLRSSTPNDKGSAYACKYDFHSLCSCCSSWPGSRSPNQELTAQPCPGPCADPTALSGHADLTLMFGHFPV